MMEEAYTYTLEEIENYTNAHIEEIEGYIRRQKKYIKECIKEHEEDLKEHEEDLVELLKYRIVRQ